MMKELDCLSLDQLESLRARYLARRDSVKAGLVREAIARRGVVQTEELARSGKLFAVEMPRDAAGRTITKWTGDNAAWMQHFMGTGAVGKIDGDLVKAAYRQGGGAEAK